MISVCIASYNGEQELGRQLDSVLPQLSPDDEVVISLDPSTDRTREVIAAYGDARLKVVDGPGLGSPIPNFENALAHASGDYIFLCDQDDQWMPKKVEVMMKALQTAACVVSDCIVTDADLNVIEPSFYAVNRTCTGFLFNLLVRNGYLGCCMAFRREVLQRALPFPKNTPMHDIWIGCVAARYYNVRFIPDRLMYYRRHGHNASTTSGKSQSTLRQKFNYRWVVIKNLF